LVRLLETNFGIAVVRASDGKIVLRQGATATRRE